MYFLWLKKILFNYLVLLNLKEVLFVDENFETLIFVNISKIISIGNIVEKFQFSYCSFLV